MYMCVFLAAKKEKEWKCCCLRLTMSLFNGHNNKQLMMMMIVMKEVEKWSKVSTFSFDYSINILQIHCYYALNALFLLLFFLFHSQITQFPYTIINEKPHQFPFNSHLLLLTLNNNKIEMNEWVSERARRFFVDR